MNCPDRMSKRIYAGHRGTVNWGGLADCYGPIKNGPASLSADGKAASNLAQMANPQSRKPTSSWLREGCWSLRTAFASIWRIRSRVTLKM